MVSLRICRGIPSHLADHYTKQDQFGVCRFLQTTQAKQLDVKKNAYIATEVTKRIDTARVIETESFHSKRSYLVLWYKTNIEKRKQMS